MICGRKLGALAIVVACSTLLNEPATAQYADAPALAGRTTSSGAVAGAVNFVEHLGRQTIAVIHANPKDAERRHEELKGVVRDGFNLEIIARFVLGHYWREATPRQRNEFRDLFTEHMLNGYARKLDSYRAETFTVISTRQVSERDVLVETEILGEDGPSGAKWRVKVESGRYKIVDVVVDGISLALAQRQEIVSVAKRLGVDGLLAIMRSKASKQARRMEHGRAMTDSSARAWMFVSFVGSSGSAMQVSLARQ